MSKPIEVSGPSFSKEVLQSQIPVLVDFWAPWCGPCRMMAPVLEKIAPQFEGRLKVCKLNTDDNPDLAGTYQITGIPCLIIFKNGEEADRLVGFHSEQDLVKKLSGLF